MKGTILYPNFKDKNMTDKPCDKDKKHLKTTKKWLIFAVVITFIGSVCSATGAIFLPASWSPIQFWGLTLVACGVSGYNIMLMIKALLGIEDINKLLNEK